MWLVGFIAGCFVCSVGSVSSGLSFGVAFAIIAIASCNGGGSERLVGLVLCFGAFWVCFLGFIVERQRRIDAFVAEDFWQIGITVEKDGQARFASSVCVHALRACMRWFACECACACAAPICCRRAIALRGAGCLFVCLFVCLFARRSVDFPSGLFVCLFVCLFVSLLCSLAPSRVCLFDCFRPLWFCYPCSGRALQLGALPTVR